jgi:CheY-like chemotaxis protein
VLFVTYRVLVVEDEPIVAMMIEDLLLETGCEPVVAASCGEALALIEQEPTFDLAIVDLNIPEGDGVTVIRALWSRARVSVIISSGYWDAAHEVRTALSPLAAPLEAITKPWPETDFLNLVRRFLLRARR